VFAQVKPIVEHSEFVNYDQALSSKNMASIDSVLCSVLPTLWRATMYDSASQEPAIAVFRSIYEFVHFQAMLELHAARAKRHGDLACAACSSGAGRLATTAMLWSTEPVTDETKKTCTIFAEYSRLDTTKTFYHIIPRSGGILIRKNCTLGWFILPIF
jgi:hypothetical protein